MYLSPDSPNVLQNLNANFVYCIGGLVDENHLKAIILFSLLLEFRILVLEYEGQFVLLILYSMHNVLVCVVHIASEGRAFGLLARAFPDRRVHRTGCGAIARQFLQSADYQSGYSNSNIHSLYSYRTSTCSVLYSTQWRNVHEALLQTVLELLYFVCARAVFEILLDVWNDATDAALRVQPACERERRTANCAAEPQLTSQTPEPDFETTGGSPSVATDGALVSPALTTAPAEAAAAGVPERLDGQREQRQPPIDESVWANAWAHAFDRAIPKRKGYLISGTGATSSSTNFDNSNLAVTNSSSSTDETSSLTLDSKEALTLISSS